MASQKNHSLSYKAFWNVESDALKSMDLAVNGRI